MLRVAHHLTMLGDSPILCTDDVGGSRGEAMLTEGGGALAIAGEKFSTVA
jgi:hypothetical protein